MGNLVSGCRRCVGWRRPRHRVEPRPAKTPAGNPLPAVVHRVVTPQELGAGRLILVGDVHGCYDTLLELLARVRYDPVRGDNLVLLGDLVNKGPKSAAVVATARAWCTAGHAWVVRGNHDDAALAAGCYVASNGAGAAAQLKQTMRWVHELLDADIEFLRELPFTLEIQGYDLLVVHAAAVPGVPLEGQDLAVLTKARDLVPTAQGGWAGVEKPVEGLSQPWAPCWQGPHHVFFGHDAKRGLQTERCATGLDTGCVYGRQLTACVLPPLAELQSGLAQSTQDAGAPPSLQQLRGELHSVPSSFVFHKGSHASGSDKATHKNHHHGNKH